VNLVT
jgi:hypothetical protein